MSLRVLEHVVRRAALAVRLTDLSTGRPVDQGVTVTAWPSAHPELAVSTDRASGRGVAGFTALPGLAAYEDGSTPRDDWFASPVVRPPVEFVVRVVDRTGDHLPLVRPVLAPSATPVDLALARSPGAPVPAGALTVTATLVDQAGRPASWAVVELATGGSLTGGIADRRGVVVIPVFRAVPPTSGGTATEGPSWRLTVRVRYRPTDHVTAPGAADDDPPTITSLLTQRPALLVDGGPLVGSLQRDLTTRGPLVLASSPPPGAVPPGPGGDPLASVLVVRPTS